MNLQTNSQHPTDATLHYTDDLPRSAAELFVEQAERSVRERGSFYALLSGGSTPLKMYHRLLQTHADAPFWAHTHLFWGDERFVPHDHPESNYGVAKGSFLDSLSVPPENIHPWPYLEGDPERAASSYETALTEVLGPVPAFDLTLLGLGDDAHTASLFPGTGAVLAEGLTTVVRPEGKGTRLSLTPRALSESRVVAFLVSGEGKREALAATLQGPNDPERYPAQAIGAQERLLWLTDVRL